MEEYMVMQRLFMMLSKLRIGPRFVSALELYEYIHYCGDETKGHREQ